MKKMLFLLLACLSYTLTSSQVPYYVEAGTDPVSLVNILTGGLIEVTNVTYSGALNGRGRFYGTSNIGLESGIILASGHVSNSIGPNNVGNKSTDFNTPGDNDLVMMAGNVSHDASTLEFDFIADDNTMSLRLVLASEEWPEYSNTGFTDVFGVFLSGPGIYGNYSSPQGFPNGAKNIAVIDTSAHPPLYISINNINNGSSNHGPCENCQYYVHNTQQSLQYDAFTVVFEIGSAVIPGETYHLKIAISDIGDYSYDSGLFIEEGSLITSTMEAGIPNARVWMSGSDLRIITPGAQDSEIFIYSLTGKQIFRGKMAGQEFSYSLQNYPKGVYIVSYRCEDKVLNTKIIR